MSTVQRPRGLNDLPNELLYEIYQYLDVGHHGYSIFNIFKVLPRVNRKLRTTAHDYWHRVNGVFDTYYDFAAQIQACEQSHYGFSDLHVEASRTRPIWDKETVQSIQVGHIRYTVNSCFSDQCNMGVICPESFLAMPRLTSWLVYDAKETPYSCYTLAACLPQLEHLGMLWKWNDCVPPIDLFPVLQSLRIIVDHQFPPHWGLPSSSCGIKSVAITSLIIHELSLSSMLLNDFCDGAKYTFPNLRILRFTETKISVPKVYDFIRRHGTLLEVNVGFAQLNHQSLRLEALVKLIQGTGNWTRSEKQPHLVLDQPSFSEYNPIEPIPPDLTFNWGAFYEFAFRRAPVAGVTDPTKPRYTCTALAVRFLDTDSDIEHLTSQLPPDICQFFVPEEIPEYLRSTNEELRLSWTIEQDTAFTFMETMQSLSYGLRNWPRLKKLALHWPFYYTYWRCPHEDTRFDNTIYVCGLCDDRKIPFLDWLPPPFYDDSRRPMSLNGLQNAVRAMRNEAFVQRLEDGIRTVLCMDEDAPLDRDDPTLLFWAWEARNYPLVASAVRLMAEARPTLEEYDWYVVHDQGDLPDVVVWKWRIRRNHDGSVRSIHGSLWWTGGSRGDPPPFLALVGQELEQTVRDARGQWRHGSLENI